MMLLLCWRRYRRLYVDHTIECVGNSELKDTIREIIKCSTSRNGCLLILVHTLNTRDILEINMGGKLSFSHMKEAVLVVLRSKYIRLNLVFLDKSIQK